jgi:phosphopantothenoylcysteine decarboxylase
VATKSALHFVDRSSLPSEVILYTDDDEWSSWKKIGDEVLHIELRKWADIMVIAPLSANTLGKVCFCLNHALNQLGSLVLQVAFSVA